jgi:3D-(3,5/4)-trihydroxycyclohexane-1,2-dione acylhydrolase (decyclizing)
MFEDVGDEHVEVDWVAHARALGCASEGVTTIAELEGAIERARASDRTTVIALRTAPHDWTPGGAFWEVGIPEVAARPEVEAARTRLLEGKRRQRVGW